MHLKRMRRLYARRQANFVRLCQELLDEWIAVTENDSGMQLLASFKQPLQGPRGRRGRPEGGAGRPGHFHQLSLHRAASMACCSATPPWTSARSCARCWLCGRCSRGCADSAAVAPGSGCPNQAVEFLQIDRGRLAQFDIVQRAHSPAPPAPPRRYCGSCRRSPARHAAGSSRIITVRLRMSSDPCRDRRHRSAAAPCSPAACRD